ncbi:MAG: InlB B-repeat-containing protein [Clostridiales bacterium]|nr:InlB B-repeat-containing protein [Clostridiales bacterium]
MAFKYVEDIKCFGCGGKELEKEHILSGFTRCTCKVCGAKFLAQGEGSDIVDRYVADRSKVTAVMETASLGEGSLSEARDGLKLLVNSYSSIADIDPVYHWYKIIFLTNNFKDFNQYEEAEREYKKVSESYAVDSTDKTRTDGYEKLYKDYCNEYEKRQNNLKSKNKKKKKLVISLIFTSVIAILLTVFLVFFFYCPVIRDDKTGVSVRINNSAYGIFDKFSVTLSVQDVEKNTPKYNVVGTALDDIAVKFEVYEINLYKSGAIANPHSKVAVTIPVPNGYNKECIGIYLIDNSGAYEEISDISVSLESIEFSTDNLSLIAIAERKLRVTFSDGISQSSDIRTVKWGECVSQPEEPKERFGYVFDGWYSEGNEYNFSLAVAHDLYLSAHWIRDSKYDGFTYIKNAEELRIISSNTNGKYLILNDIDLGGAYWKVINSFQGTIDGGCHAIYNFKVNTAADFWSIDSATGFIGQLLTGATVKNLQIGKEGSVTKFDYAPWQRNVHAGAIAGYSNGNIINCRAVSCSISISVSAQQDIYKDSEFASNVGGICGVVREGAIQRCYVTNCNLNSDTWSRYNNISNTARCAGISGYSDKSNIIDCLTENNIITATSKTLNSAWGNHAGQPFPVVGGIIGHAVSTTITRDIVINNTLTPNREVGDYSNGQGFTYHGCMMGLTNSTVPSNLIGVKTTINCSGSNASYQNFKNIAENSFTLLVSTDVSFDKWYWTDNEGAIALLFAEQNN